MGLLEQRGHELTSEAKDAEALVVNTCSFIETAKQESIDTILEACEYKRTGNARRLVVAGCLVERYRREPQAEIPEIDAVLGTGEIESIIDHCEGTGAVAPAGSGHDYLYHDLTPRRRATPRHFAYVKINEGCDHPCSFCIIPQLRGGFRSRHFESIISEARRLFGEGGPGTDPDRTGHYRLRRGSGRPERSAGSARTAGLRPLGGRTRRGCDPASADGATGTACERTSGGLARARLPVSRSPARCRAAFGIRRVRGS